MGAHVVDDVGDLRVAHHVSDWRHAFQPVKLRPSPKVNRIKVLVGDERGIGPSADGAFRVRLMTATSFVRPDGHCVPAC